jgi:hypothetical protein
MGFFPEKKISKKREKALNLDFYCIIPDYPHVACGLTKNK